MPERNSKHFKFLNRYDFLHHFDKHKNAVFCLGGDFNLPDINWEQEEIVSNQNPFALNSLFLTMAQDLSLNQIINFPTRGTSILDLLFTNRPEIFKSPKLLAGVGDHEIISHNIRYLLDNYHLVKIRKLVTNKNGEKPDKTL